MIVRRLLDAAPAPSIATEKDPAADRVRAVPCAARARRAPRLPEKESYIAGDPGGARSHLVRPDA